MSAKLPEKGSGGTSETVQNPPPPKAKRGRPKKTKTPARSEVVAIDPPQVVSKPASGTTTPIPPATKATAPKNGKKPGDGDAPRPGGRGRKRQLLNKPSETTNADKTQENAVGPPASSSQETSVPAQKRSAKAQERKLHGAAAKAKAAALKRKRDEETQSVTLVPKNVPSRGGKKDGEALSPEVSEVPPPAAKKGRPSKRLKQQAPRQVSKEVIRIEDDDIPTERNATGTPPKELSRNEEQATGTAAAQEVEKVNAMATAPLKGRQSLPASHKQAAPRRSKIKDLTSAAAPNRRVDGPSQDEVERADEGTPKSQPTGSQKPKESAKAKSHAQGRRSRVVRHSTGNISPMEIDAHEESHPNVIDAKDSVSNKKAVESMLDEIQRNAIPFLLKQDKICDSFSAHLEKDVDDILKNTASDVFQVFSDQVKDALVADRIRLAIASAKTELRRGMEKLLREFARRVGTPLRDENASLLLRNEAFLPSKRAKEERRQSRPFAITSPRISKLVSRRLMEENHDPNNGPHMDYVSDDPDRYATTPRSRKVPLKDDIPLLANVADMKRFAQRSFENLDLNCYRALTILKLCARPGGMSLAGLHEVTPLGLQMIRNKVRDLVDRGYLVEDIVRENGGIATVYSTAAHVTEA